MFTSGAALVWKAEFGLNGLPPQEHKALHEWEMFKGRIDGGDAAEDQKKNLTLITFVPVEPCGDDSLTTECTTWLLTIASNKH